MKVLFFDTETTGLPKNREPAINGSHNWPHMVSISWVLQDDGKTIDSQSFIVKPNWQIPEDSIKIHGITQQRAWRDGRPLKEIIERFFSISYDWIVAHNIDFDLNVLINACLWDLKMSVPRFGKQFCTMKNSIDICRIPMGTRWKSPKLGELYEHIFNKKPIQELLHSSSYDTQLLVEIVEKFKPFRKILGLPIEDVERSNVGLERNQTICL